MAQYKNYYNKNPQSKKEFPLLLDIQTNLLDSLQTTVVVPLKNLNQMRIKRYALESAMKIEIPPGNNYLFSTALNSNAVVLLRSI